MVCRVTRTFDELELGVEDTSMPFQGSDGLGDVDCETVKGGVMVMTHVKAPKANGMNVIGARRVMRL